MSQTDAFGQKTQHNQIHKETISKNAVIGKHSSLNSYPQIEFSNFVNLLAKNIDDSSKNAENLKTFK